MRQVKHLTSSNGKETRPACLQRGEVVYAEHARYVTCGKCLRVLATIFKNLIRSA